MIIWSGFGFLVAVFTFAFCVLAQHLADGAFGDGYYSSHKWVIGIALILGGLLSAGVGLVLNRPVEGIRLNRHGFFFIPMQYAGLVISAIGIVLVIVGLVS